MKVKCDEYNGVCVLAIEGEFTEEAGAQVKHLASERLTRGGANFVIDLEKSPFVNSRGLETLLWLKRQCDQRLGHVKLVGLDDNIRKVFEITRLLSRFECHMDLASALKAA